MTSIDWLPASFLAASRLRELAAGETLFRQGDASFAIFAVERGRVQLIRHATEDRTIILHSARAGELFAEAALYSEIYHCDAVASVLTHLRILPKPPLRLKHQHLHSISVLASQFGAKLVDLSDNSVIVEMCGKTSRVEAFLSLVKPFGVLESARTGECLCYCCCFVP